MKVWHLFIAWLILACSMALVVYRLDEVMCTLNIMRDDISRIEAYSCEMKRRGDILNEALRSPTGVWQKEKE